MARLFVMGGTSAQRPVRQVSLSGHPANRVATLWMYEMAWCVRERLNPVEASTWLFKNVADTLGYWDSALGLCRTMYPTDEAFWAAADNFQPEDFADQYRGRLSLARERGLAPFQQTLERTELRLRRLIGQSSLSLTPEEVKALE